MKTVKISDATRNAQTTTTTTNTEPTAKKFDLQCVNYSEKCLVVFGTYTKEIVNELKQIGGKFNAKLNPEIIPTGAGWIFKTENAAKIKNFMCLQRIKFFDDSLTALFDVVKPVIYSGNSTQRANFLKPFFLIDSALKEYQNAFITAL